MIGDNVRRIRNSKGFSMDKIREITGLSKSTISELETNKSNPTSDTLQKIADALEVDVTEFYKDENLQDLDENYNKDEELAEQVKFIESLQLDSPADAMKFILSQPSLMAYGGYDLNEMDEDELMDLANDMLFAMKLSLEKNKRK